MRNLILIASTVFFTTHASADSLIPQPCVVKKISAWATSLCYANLSECQQAVGFLNRLNSEDSTLLPKCVEQPSTGACAGKNYMLQTRVTVFGC